MKSTLNPPFLSGSTVFLSILSQYESLILLLLSLLLSFLLLAILLCPQFELFYSLTEKDGPFFALAEFNCNKTILSHLPHETPLSQPQGPHP